MDKPTNRDRAEQPYELRFQSLFNPGAGYAFPCDADGRVDLDALSEKCRSNYHYARAIVGSQLSAPAVIAAPCGGSHKRP